MRRTSPVPYARVLVLGPCLLALGVGVASCGRGCHASVSREWDASYSMSFGGASGADASAGSTAAGTAGTAAVAPDAAVDAAAFAEAGKTERDSGVLPPGMSGVFHRNEGPDERNLEIDPDGTFFWRIYGCDFGGGACGQWSVDGTSLVLTPVPPATTMAWEDGATFNRSVTKVVLRQKGGALEARIFASDGEKLLQAWYPGRICVDCGGRSGTMTLAPCTKPLMRSCP